MWLRRDLHVVAEWRIIVPLLVAGSVAVTGAATVAVKQDTIPSGIVVTGGFYYDAIVSTAIPNVEVMNMKQLPYLPEATMAHTLTSVGEILYNCGGRDGHNQLFSQCYTLNASELVPTWRTNVTLPKAMQSHTAVAVSAYIWFTYNNQVYVYDTVFSMFEAFETPFHVTNGHCAVSNSTHSFVMGVGPNSNEIWVNTNAFFASLWKHVGTMTTKRNNFGCFWHGNEIFITGGIDTEKSVEIFDVNFFQIRNASSLLETRRYHGMALLSGRPAVVGGYSADSGQFLDSIETWDSSYSKWSNDSLRLQQARDQFGITQILNPITKS